MPIVKQVRVKINATPSGIRYFVTLQCLISINSTAYLLGYTRNFENEIQTILRQRFWAVITGGSNPSTIRNIYSYVPDGRVRSRTAILYRVVHPTPVLQSIFDISAEYRALGEQLSACIKRFRKVSRDNKYLSKIQIFERANDITGSKP